MATAKRIRWQHIIFRRLRFDGDDTRAQFSSLSLLGKKLFASSHRGPSIVNRRGLSLRLLPLLFPRFFIIIIIFLFHLTGEDGMSNVRARFERGTVGIVYSSNRQLTDIMLGCLRLRYVVTRLLRPGLRATLRNIRFATIHHPLGSRRKRPREETLRLLGESPRRHRASRANPL